MQARGPNTRQDTTKTILHANHQQQQQQFKGHINVNFTHNYKKYRPQGISRNSKRRVDMIKNMHMFWLYFFIYKK